MDLLTGDQAGAVLAAACEVGGLDLAEWRVVSVTERGSSLAVQYLATVDPGDGARDTTMVAHVSDRRVPEGATVLTVGSHTVHVWRWPWDPYLPGLPSAVTPLRVHELLARLGVEARDVGLRTRSYQPTRRAVVELTVDGNPDTRVFLKVVGGRTADRVQARAERLAQVHRGLQDTLPVPRLLGVATSQGIVAIEARPGVTLRTALLEDREVPAPEVVVALGRMLAATSVPDGADPARYASADRHVDRLRRLLPQQGERAAQLTAAIGVVGGPIGTVHGDLHDGQLLVQDGTITALLDVDGAGRGQLALDAGRIVAWVESAGLTTPRAVERTQAYADALVDAYTTWVPLQEVARAAGLAWIGLATAPHRLQVEAWEAATLARLDRAERWVEQLG